MAANLWNIVCAARGFAALSMTFRRMLHFFPQLKFGMRFSDYILLLIENLYSCCFWVNIQRIWQPFNARMRQQPGKERCFITKCMSTQSLSKTSTILLIIGLFRVQSNRGSIHYTDQTIPEGYFRRFLRMNRESFDFLLNVIRRQLVVDGVGLGFPRSLNI